MTARPPVVALRWILDEIGWDWREMLVAAIENGELAVVNAVSVDTPEGNGAPPPGLSLSSTVRRADVREWLATVESVDTTPLWPETPDRPGPEPPISSKTKHMLYRLIASLLITYGFSEHQIKDPKGLAETLNREFSQCGEPVFYLRTLIRELKKVAETR